MATIYKLVVIASLLFVCQFQKVHGEMSMKQVEAAKRLARSMCQSKSKVTDDLIDNLRDGKWESNKKLMCYVDCCLNVYKAMRNGVVDVDAAMAQLKQAPASMRAIIEPSLNHCKDSAVGTEKCEPAFNLAKCMYDFNPESNIVPVE